MNILRRLHGISPALYTGKPTLNFGSSSERILWPGSWQNSHREMPHRTRATPIELDEFELMRSGDRQLPRGPDSGALVSRTRCSVFHAAPQSRGTMWVPHQPKRITI